MAPKPIIIFDTIPKVRVSGLFRVGLVSYFNDHLGGLSGVTLVATDGTTTTSQSKTYNSLRTEFYDVGSHNGTSYSTYSGYINPNFYYSGFPLPAWAYEFTFNTTGFLGNSSEINFTATAYPNNTDYSSRTISGFTLIKDTLVSKPVVWVDGATGVDTSGRGSQSLPYKSFGYAMGRTYQDNGQVVDLGNTQIYLKSGNYDYIANPPASFPYSIFESNSGWVDIQPAPGVARSSVRINTAVSGWTPSNNTKHHLHFKNITFSGIAPFGAIANNQECHIWLDNCYAKGGETFNTGNATCMANNLHYAYFTNTIYTNVLDGMGWGTLTRDCLVENYMQAAFRIIGEGYPTNGNKTERLILNSQAYNQNALGTEAHPDVLHFDFIVPTGTIAMNVAAQGVRATVQANSQGIFGGATSPQHKDVAFVNILCESGNSRLGGGVDHLIMRNCTFPSGNWLWMPGQMYPGPHRQWYNVECTSNVFNTMGVESGTEAAFIDAFTGWSGNFFSHNAFHTPGLWSGMGPHVRSGIIEYNSGLDHDWRAYPMLGNCIFAIGYVPSGWNNNSTQIITHLQPDPMVWAYDGAFAPLFPDLGAWYQTANDPRTSAPSLSADCIISPAGCRRGPTGSTKGSSATRMFINVLRPSNMTMQQYEELLNQFLQMIINAIIGNHR